MNKLIIVILSLFSIVMSFTACDNGETTYVKVPGDVASVSIDIIQPVRADHVQVLFTPTENISVKFEYAIGVESDREAFTNGSLTAINQQDGGEPLTVTFESLESVSSYTIFARAYNSDGVAGPVASREFTTRDESGITYSMDYISDSSAAFSISTSTDYYKVMYALGAEEDREAFENGTLEGIISHVETMSYTASFFSLEPETDYLFFLKAVDRGGNETITFDIPVTTLTKDAVPSIGLEVIESDIYRTEYRVSPNSVTKKVAFVAVEKTLFDTYIPSWNGNVLSMLEAWTQDQQNRYNIITLTGTTPLTAYFESLILLNNVEVAVYALHYDNTGDPSHVQSIKFETPDFDPGAGKARVGIEVTDISSAGATYTFNPNSETLLFFSDTVEADWFDEFVETDEYYDYYLHERFYTEWLGFQYIGSPIATFVETGASPNTRYYAITCPMNANGRLTDGTGWGDLVKVEYTTTN